MAFSKSILPNLSNLENHLAGYSTTMSKAQYKSFKKVMLSFLSNKAKSVSQMARKQQVKRKSLDYFFNKMDGFNEVEVLEKSIKVSNNITAVRSTTKSFIILDFTDSRKEGRSFEFADYLFNEEKELADIYGYENLIALEFNPIKNSHKALGIRRHYHQGILKEDHCCIPEDFEKKPICCLPALIPYKSKTIKQSKGDNCGQCFYQWFFSQPL